MLERFRQFAASQHLFPDRGEVLLAVSGGRDSVALVDLMRRCDVPFAVAHCNFHLRPDECDRDQQFVHSLSERIGVRYFTVGFDTVAYAAKCGLSIEDAARKLRYGWFSELCHEHAFECVVTAHHRDDSIETFFLNLFRGTGITGLHGIRPFSELKVGNHDVKVVRPMLCFSRAEIDGYISERKLEYVEDSTNASLDVRRNRIRLRLMPLLRELYPSVDATMEANIARLSDAGIVFDSYVTGLRRRLIFRYEPKLVTMPIEMNYVRLSEIRLLDPPRTLLFELLRPYGFNAAVADDILKVLDSGHGGQQFFSPDYVAEIHRGNLLLAVRKKADEPKLDMVTQPLDYSSMNEGCKGFVEFFDADTLSYPLSVRPWREGDRFCPLGMKGTRLVSDFMKDSGLSIIERQYVHLLVDANDRPLWVIGLRIDNHFRLSQSTTRMLRVECIKQNNS